MRDLSFWAMWKLWKTLPRFGGESAERLRIRHDGGNERNPLAAELARNLGQKTYLVARKSVKAYMDDPICVEDESITTMGKQKLYLSASDVALIRGKKVLLVDDVISTGGSMKALKELAEKAGAQVCCQAAILAEGDAAKRDDIVFLEELPLLEAE